MCSRRTARRYHDGGRKQRCVQEGLQKGTTMEERNNDVFKKDRKKVPRWRKKTTVCSRRTAERYHDGGKKQRCVQEGPQEGITMEEGNNNVFKKDHRKVP
ncbi:hypothetical protein R1flu_012964 [Riccia fluitans]|uniref:Uncharacterized protein n=1 Tax=Riccia fluitans TaxID=41844 RepID=A0ABD1ZG74_9MARC